MDADDPRVLEGRRVRESYHRFNLARLKSLDVEDSYIAAEGEKQTVYEIIGIEEEQDKIYTAVRLETGWIVEYVSRNFFFDLARCQRSVGCLHCC